MPHEPGEIRREVAATTDASGGWKCPTCGKWGYLFRWSHWGDDVSEAGLIAAARERHRQYSPKCSDVDMTGEPRILQECPPWLK